jgi:hypothetical protein
MHCIEWIARLRPLRSLTYEAGSSGRTSPDTGLVAGLWVDRALPPANVGAMGWAAQYFNWLIKIMGER